jgi:hypothetical protein
LDDWNRRRRRRRRFRWMIVERTDGFRLTVSANLKKKIESEQM